MAHIFSSINTADFRGWGIIPIDQCDAVVLTGDPDSPVKVCKGNRDYSRAHVIKEKIKDGSEMFVLVTPAEAKQQVRINGDPILAGIRVLQDHDEIVVRSYEGESYRLFFSIEKIAKIEQLSEHDHAANCARCLKKINPGDQVVKCPAPGCRAVHHQSDEFNCWTYNSKCANSMCYQDTEISSEFRWVP